MLKRLFFLLLPVILVVAIYFASPYLSRIPKTQHSIIFLLPYLTLVVGMVLSWRFNRSRAFFSLLLVMTAYVLLISRPAMAEVTSRWLELGVALLLPFNLLLLSLFKERGIFTAYGIVRFGFLLAQALGLAWLVHKGDLQWLEWAEHSWLQASWLPPMGVSQLVLGVFLLLCLWQLLRALLQVSLVESGMLGVLLATMAPLALNVDKLSQAVYFGLAGLMLIIALVQESYGMAYLDELTGLPGRRAMRENLASLGSRYAIAMLDVDHFKKFNDTHGHDVGDQVLRMVASQVRRISGGGKPARYGGEEFAIIFPGKGVADVCAHLEVLRQRIEDSPFIIRDKKQRPKNAPEKRQPRRRNMQQVSVTISIGVAESSSRHPTADAVMKAADQALYRAKQGGRNQVSK